MGSDHLANGIGVYETGEEDEGDKVIVQYFRIEVKVGNDESPGREEGEETEKSAAGLVAAGATYRDYIERTRQKVSSIRGGSGREIIPLDCVQYENYSSLHHIPFVEWKLVNIFGYESIVRNPNSCEHRLLPEASPAFDGCECVDRNQDQYSFHRPGNQTQSQSVCMVFVPGLYVESKEGCKETVREESAERFESSLHAKSTATVFHPIPKFCEAAKMRHSRDVLTASTP